MGNSAEAVAHHFLSTDRRFGITPLKLQKLVYVSYGCQLALYDEPLIDNENAQAWRYGPVFPSLYHGFKHFGNMPIRGLASEAVFSSHGFRRFFPEIEEHDLQTTELLERIWKVYGQTDGLQLSESCHSRDSLWDQTRKATEGATGVEIDDCVIRTYYKNRLRRNQENKERATDHY